MKHRIFLTLMIVHLSLAWTSAQAENAPTGPLVAPAVAPIPGPVVVPAPESRPSPSPSPKRKKRREVKETEGSVAPGRFEAETILKSQYHLNGQQLEVDPD